MKKNLAILAAVLLVPNIALAIPVSIFQGTDKFIERAQDIVIARCISVPPEPGGFEDGLYPASVEVMMVLKGERKQGPLKIATIHPLKQGDIYMLANTGGSAFETDFLAIGELSVVHFPWGFDLVELKRRTLKQQVEKIFALHLYEVERELRPLLEEQERLKKGLKGRTDDRFDSKGNVEIGEIKELKTSEANQSRWFDLPPGKLEWSHSSPGKTGFVYYSYTEADPHWEYASTESTSLEAFNGKPQSAQFFGLYSPGSGDNARMVKVGDVILARTVNEPETIYIVQFASQAANEESATIRWTTVKAAK